MEAEILFKMIKTCVADIRSVEETQARETRLERSIATVESKHTDILMT